MREYSSEGRREGQLENSKKAFRDIMVDGRDLLQGVRPAQDIIDRLIVDIQTFRNMAPHEIMEVLESFDKWEAGSIGNVGLANAQANNSLSKILKIASSTYPNLITDQRDKFLMEKLYNSLDLYEAGKTSPRTTRKRIRD